MDQFFARSARIYTEDDVWVANVTEVEGGDGEGIMSVDMISAEFENLLVDHVMMPQETPTLKIKLWPEDTAHMPVRRETDYIVLYGVRVYEFHMEREVGWPRLITRDAKFFYKDTELNLFANLTLDTLQSEYEID